MIADEVSYRRATPADAEDLATFGSQAFVDAFDQAVPPPDLVLHLVRTFSPERQRAELFESATWSMVAEHRGELVAAALVRLSGPPAQLAPEFSWAELVRFCVGKPYWRTGVSSGLIGATFVSMSAAGARAAWVQVWEHALRAIRFYRRCGFLEVDQTGSRFGAETHRDLLMARRLPVR